MRQQQYEAQRSNQDRPNAGQPQLQSLRDRNSFQQFNDDDGRDSHLFELQMSHQPSGDDLFPQQTGNFNFNQSEMSDRNTLFKFDSRDDNNEERLRKRTSGVGNQRNISPLQSDQLLYPGLNVDDILGGERPSGGEVGPSESILREPLDKGMWLPENSFSPSANIAKQDEDKIGILANESNGLQRFIRGGGNISDQNQLSTTKESYASYSSFRNQAGYLAEQKPVDNFMIRNLAPQRDEAFTKQIEFMLGKSREENVHPDFPENAAIPDSPNIFYHQQRHYSEQILPSQIKYAQPIGNQRAHLEKLRESGLTYQQKQQPSLQHEGHPSFESTYQNAQTSLQQRVPDFSHLASFDDQKMQNQSAPGVASKISAIGGAQKFPKDTSLINENKQKSGHSISPLLGFSQPSGPGPIQLQRRQSTQLPEEKKHSPLLTISVNQPQLSFLPPFDSLKAVSNAFESPTNNANRLAPSEGEYNEGKWTDEEHNKFLQGLVKFGKNWNSIQKFIKTRTCPQTRSHAQKFFRKLQKHGYLQGMSTSSDMNIDAVVGNNGEMGGDQMASDEELTSNRGGAEPPQPIIRSMSLSQLPIQPQIGKRPRLNSMRSDKTRERASNHELSDLERQVIEVLNRYSNGASSLRIAKLDSEQNLAFETLAPSPSAAQTFEENLTKTREKSQENQQQPQRMSTRSQSPIKQKQNESPTQQEQGPPNQPQYAIQLPQAPQNEGQDQTPANAEKKQRRQPLNFHVPTSPHAPQSTPNIAENKNPKGANKNAKINDVSQDFTATQATLNQPALIQTKGTGAAVSGKNRSKQNIEEFKISALPQEPLTKSPKDNDEESALQSPEQPLPKLGSRKASEISIPGKKSAKKRQAKQYSFEKLRKYQQNVKYRKIFKTYRFDTEEGRRLYQLENEHSYTSGLGRYYYDESCSRALRSERNADGSYRSVELGEHEARSIIEEDLKEPIDERTTEMKLGNVIDIQSIEGPQQTWNIIKLSHQVESDCEKQRQHQVREFQVNDDLVGAPIQRQQLGSLSITPRQQSQIHTPLQQAQENPSIQNSSFLQQQPAYQGGMGGGTIVNQQASHLYGNNMTANSSSFYQGVPPPQAYTPDIFDQQFNPPSMAGEFDQRNGATSFMSGVPQTQGPYEYQILSYLQQPISQTLIGQGAHQPFGQNAQQSYAQAFANYQLQENPYAHPPLQNRPSYPAQQPAAGASTFGGIQLRMEEDQRPEGGYVSDPSESPAQMRRRRESFR